MGKRAVPRGCTKKIPCKCGRYFFPKLIGSTLNLTTECNLCNREAYKEKEKKEIKKIKWTH